MPSHNLFRWLDGAGWLVLAGSADEVLRARALGKIAADGGIAYLVLSGDSQSGERALDDMVDLGAPSGYLVDVSSEDDATIEAKLAEAGMVVIEAGATLEDARASLVGAALDGIQIAYENGAIILVEGVSAMLFGEWTVLADGELKSGFEWLGSAVIAPGVTNTAEWARDLLQSNPALFAVGIGAGSALALGGGGEVELWGHSQVTVALGSKFTLIGTSAESEES